jgi:hypothetical protein
MSCTETDISDAVDRGGLSRTGRLRRPRPSLPGGAVACSTRHECHDHDRRHDGRHVFIGFASGTAGRSSALAVRGHVRLAVQQSLRVVPELDRGILRLPPFRSMSRVSLSLAMFSSRPATRAPES